MTVTGFDPSALMEYFPSNPDVARLGELKKYSEDQPRDDHGRWTSGGEGESASSIVPITASEARGNSRPVSAAEYTSLAREGAQRLAAIQADSRPATALNDSSQWESVKASAFAAVQESWGGQTINPGTGAILSADHGYALTIRNPGQDPISVAEDASRQVFDQAMNEAKSQYGERQLQGAQTYLGVFHDDSLKRVDIDPVVVVQSVREVETIGAFTHSVGGAYDFATGNGVWVPHVSENAA